MTKNIVLCSDGTGKKGGHGNATNVFKLYQAVDLHHSGTQQISFYDNGLGTKEDGSTVKSNEIWIALSGALGLGFKSNVRDLYEFLARHYQSGDNVYIFGYSRGAATVRAFIGFINCCGLLDKSKTNSEAEFQSQINHALEAYCKIRSNPELAYEFKEKFAITDGNCAPNGNLHIHFLGVWDTVSALGFPDGTWKTSDWFFKIMDEVFKVLKKWTDKFWPHQFYQYDLTDNILNAHQALAIDDERKTFHPKVWNEHNRQSGRVEQVWFAGSHANVGGGHPRSGLSNVTLDWMFKRAAENGLIFIKEDVIAAEGHSNAQDKLYDSRDGMRVFYRYEPRNIENLCLGQTSEATKIEAGKIQIHKSVIERVNHGTALYSPGFLPTEFEMVETDSEQKTTVSIDKEKYNDCQQELSKWVEKRQWLYRTFMEITLVMIFAVLLFWHFPPESVKQFAIIESTQNLSACQGFQEGLNQCAPEAVSLFPPQSWLYGLLSYIFPAMFKNFIIYVICIQPVLFIIMLLTLVTLIRQRQKHQNELSKTLAKQRLLLLETFQNQIHNK